MSIHLGEAHALDDVSINTIVKEVEMETGDQVAETGDLRASSDDDGDLFESESDESDKPIASYTEEVKFICDILNCEYKKDVKFIELKLLYGWWSCTALFS